MPALLVTDGRLTAEALSSLRTPGATRIGMVTWKGEEDDGALQSALVELFAPG